jgi:hypothetical protein
VAEGADVGSGRRTAGLIVGGVGVAGLAVGAVFGIITMGKKSTYTNLTNDPAHCPNKNQCDDTVNQARQDMSMPGLISTIGFVAGGALVVSGAILFLTAPKGVSMTGAGRWRVVPAVGSGNAGAVVTRSF